MDRARLLKHFDTLADTPDAVAKLRSLVLNLAIKGDLRLSAPHETVDETYLQEPASETLPSHWRLLNFGKHCDIQGGNQPPKSKFLNHPAQGYVQLLQIRDLGTNPVPTYIPRESTNRFCKPGEILVGRYGASVGKVFWAKDGAYNVALAKFIYPTNAFIPEFAFLVLKSEFFQSPIAGASRSAQAGFNKGDLSSIDLPLPPLAEQKRIVARVEELLALCDELEARQTAAREQRTRLVQSAFDHLTAAATPADFRRHAAFALQEFPHLTATPDSIPALRQAILSLAVEGHLVRGESNDRSASEELILIRKKKASLALRKPSALPPISADECPFALPEKWAWARWGEIADWITYGFTRPMPHVEKGVPIVTAKNVQDGYLDLSTSDKTTEDAFAELSDKDRPEAGDILITKDGTIGRAGIVPAGNRFCINQSVAVVWLRSCHLDRQWLLLVIRSAWTQRPIWEKAEGAAIKHISVVDFARMVLPIPPLAEQQRIVAKVAALMSWCDELEARLAAAQNAAAALLDSSLHALLAE
jgi:type I restriction enzyme S subunit